MNIHRVVGAFALLVFSIGCSTEKQRQVATLRNMDHAQVWEQLSSFWESSDWPAEKTFSKLGEGKPEPKTPIPNQVADLSPWGVFVFPDDPPRIEFAFWVPTETWQRDTVSLTYVFDDGEIQEGIYHEDANSDGTEISVTAKIEEIAESTYLTTSE